MFWVFRVCVCVHVRVHVYMRGKELHILVYSSLLSIYQCRWALCCMEKVKCKRLAITKTKLKAIFFILLGFITVLYLVPMSGESFYILKKPQTHTQNHLGWMRLGFSSHSETEWSLEQKQRQWWVWVVSGGSRDALQASKFLVFFPGWEANTSFGSKT